MGEVARWRKFREYLPKREREDFDRMLDEARFYNSAAFMAVRTAPLEGMAMSVLLYHFGQLEKLSERAKRLEQGKKAPKEEKRATP
jgi:hypothetical protein